MKIFNISDDSSYQDESSESIEPHNSQQHIKLADRTRKLGGRTVSSISVPTAGSLDEFASVSIPVPNLKPKPKLNRVEKNLSVPLPREL